jgi:hypothetical protein
VTDHVYIGISSFDVDLADKKVLVEGAGNLLFLARNKMIE